MTDKTVVVRKVNKKSPKHSAFYISDTVMSVKEMNNDNDKYMGKVSNSATIYLAAFFAFLTEFMTLASYSWLGIDILNFEESLIPFAILIIIAVLFFVVLSRVIERDFGRSIQDSTDVANRILKYYDREKGRFDFSSAPLFFLMSVSKQYKPPKVMEAEKMVVRKNGFLVLVILPLICAVATPVVSFLQSDAKDYMGRITTALSNPFNDAVIVLILIAIIGLLARILYLPTSLVRRSPIYKYIICAYPFIASELERRYSGK